MTFDRSADLLPSGGGEIMIDSEADRVDISK